MVKMFKDSVRGVLARVCCAAVVICFGSEAMEPVCQRRCEQQIGYYGLDFNVTKEEWKEAHNKYIDSDRSFEMWTADLQSFSSHDFLNAVTSIEDNTKLNKCKLFYMWHGATNRLCCLYKGTWNREQETKAVENLRKVVDELSSCEEKIVSDIRFLIGVHISPLSIVFRLEQ
ncbi:MAG: hypothetical protein LBB25_04505 [Holosporaceae bacterium]|jgi:hypothetical protein|nr:hypothetical protein [Holosporaceae bacterium]